MHPPLATRRQPQPIGRLPTSPICSARIGAVSDVRRRRPRAACALALSRRAASLPVVVHDRASVGRRPRCAPLRVHRASSSPGAFSRSKHRGWALVHLPAVAWAAWTEFTATVCPLTPWENALRAEAGDARVQRRVRRALHRAVDLSGGLTPDAQLGLGIGIVAVNAVIYAFAWRRSRLDAGVGT